MMLVRINAQLGWTVAQDPQSLRWVGVCPALAITAEAESFSKLTEMMNEEVNELMRDLLEEGSLDSYLHERGWTSLPGTPIPRLMPAEGVNFDVPMEIRLNSVAGLSARARNAQA